MEAKSLLIVLELDHLAGLEKVLQSYRGERVIFHGPSKFRARTGKSIGHGTQVGIKASPLRQSTAQPSRAGSLAKYFLSILRTFPSANRASRAAWRARRLAMLTLSSSVLVRDLVFSNFNSAALSLDSISMALSESPFLMRGGSQGESKTAWPEVDFS
jgi:hypothetical protein